LLDSGLKIVEVNFAPDVRTITIGVLLRNVEFDPLKEEQTLQRGNFAYVSPPTVGELDDVVWGLADCAKG
jgi:hypothetical protein